MLGEGLMYCMQSKLKSCPKSESSINAGGCSFNSFLRRTVRFVGAYEERFSPSFLTSVFRLFWNWGHLKNQHFLSFSVGEILARGGGGGGGGLVPVETHFF